MDIINLLSRFLKEGFGQNSNSSTNLNANTNFNTAENNSNSHIFQPADYPEVIFTTKNNYKAQNFTGNQNPNSSTSSPFNMGMIGNLLGADGFKNILPLLTKSGGKNNFSNILEKINPQLSGLVSTFSKNNKKDERTSSSSKPNLIDISDYTEIS